MLPLGCSAAWHGGQTHQKAGYAQHVQRYSAGSECAAALGARQRCQRLSHGGRGVCVTSLASAPHLVQQLAVLLAREVRRG